jgi:hypothetical protein
MDYNKFEKNLILLLKIFNGRPNHLSKFLIENNGFNEDFIELVTNSKKLNNLKDFDLNKMDFTDFKEMNTFFKELIDTEKTSNNLERDLNDKLFNFISEEKFEEAANLRDYMIKNNIKIKL